MLRTLLQPRYAALSALMLVVAAICTVAGSWQVARSVYKAHANGELRHNAHASTVPIADVLPTSGTVSRDRVQFRSVRAAGVFQTSGQVLVRRQQVNDDNGFLVLTPFRTDDGPTLLVVRGFISEDDYANGRHPVPNAPGGHVDLSGRVQTASTATDQFSASSHGQVETINARQQAERLNTRVYVGYVELLADQPGTQGLTVIPDPDLSNPAGGAIEPQHVAYVIQWFIFAGLALAAPVAMAKAETKRAPTQFDEDLEPLEPPDPAQAKLVDRYGRGGR